MWVDGQILLLNWAEHNSTFVIYVLPRDSLTCE